MTPSNESAEVRRLLDHIDEARRPSPEERARIEARMWTALTDQPDVRPDTVFGKAEIHRMEVTEAGSDPEPEGNRRWVWPLLAAAVIALAVVVGVTALDDSGDGGANVVVSADGAVTQVEAELEGGTLSFSGEGFDVVDSGTNFVVIAVGESATAAAEQGITQLVTIARPVSLFDGLEPEAWFEREAVRAQPVPARYRGDPIPSWSLSVNDEAVQAQGCEVGQPCVDVADLGPGDPPLALPAGVLATLRLVPTDSGEPIVLLATGQMGVSVGAGFDPLARLQDELLGSITFD